MHGQREAFRLAHAELATCWAGGMSAAERWAVYDAIHDRLVAQWPAEAHRIVGMMVMWVTEIRGTCPTPYRSADAGLNDGTARRACRIDS